ncbi:MAG: nitroreductase family protein [Chlamydiota bacterium]
MTNSPPIQKLIKDRWSPRAMSSEPLSKEELMPLFEAARWAPSSYNAQPWRFIYAHRGSKHWDLLFDLLVPFNQSWAKNAAALVLILSRTTFSHNNKPSPTHSFDTGAAWENLALEGHARGLVVHGMQGFDYQKAIETFQIPTHYQVEAMVAIGKQGPLTSLDDSIRKDEHPKERLSLDDLISEGIFNFT